MAFSYKPKVNFAVEDEKAMATPPTINFGASAKPAN
jgi:hypothetical protein